MGGLYGYREVAASRRDDVRIAQRFIAGAQGLEGWWSPGGTTEGGCRFNRPSGTGFLEGQQVPSDKSLGYSHLPLRGNALQTLTEDRRWCESGPLNTYVRGHDVPHASSLRACPTLRFAKDGAPRRQTNPPSPRHYYVPSSLRPSAPFPIPSVPSSKKPRRVLAEISEHAGALTSRLLQTPQTTPSPCDDDRT